MERQRRVFFAIPYDSATLEMYGRITESLRSEFPGLVTIIGKNEIGPSREYSEIASFKAQNQEMTTQFISQITEADLVVADLTHNNPNVHVELGIALLQNKNVLRVTGRGLTELGFDIRNLEVHGYRDEATLRARIAKYVTMFLQIKQLPFSDTYGPLYRRLSDSVRLGSGPERRPPPTDEFQLHRLVPEGFRFRDGAIRAEFELEWARDSSDWFGIYFRAVAHPVLGSELVYCRHSGEVEVAVNPGPHVTDAFPREGPTAGRQTILLEFENNELEIEIGGVRHRSTKLVHQQAGEVWLATWNARAAVYSAEVISRDTIDMLEP